jgi:hypothetical protein
MVVF